MTKENSELLLHPLNQRSISACFFLSAPSSSVWPDYRTVEAGDAGERRKKEKKGGRNTKKFPPSSAALPFPRTRRRRRRLLRRTKKQKREGGKDQASLPHSRSAGFCGRRRRTTPGHKSFAHQKRFAEEKGGGEKRERKGSVNF